MATVTQGAQAKAVPRGEQAMSVSAARAAMLDAVTPVARTEIVQIKAALGRVLADNVHARVNVPPHDNSAMDGYAFDGQALAQAARTGAALVLQVAGTALAGSAWRAPVGAGQCVKIMTGAVMPSGLDTVVPQEMVVQEAPDRIRLPLGQIRAGDNRRLAGEDLRRGHPALRRGERLGPAACGLIASLGLGQVEVVRRLRVAYFSTGNEILSLGEAPREGAVYDSNRYTVRALLQRLGCTFIDLGVVRDEPALLEAAFTQAAAQADAIITSGGVSVGEADLTRQLMKQLGDVAFWRIAMRPGRPMAAGRIHPPGQPPAVLFGLPGNPVAVMVTFLAFVRPALLRMMGARPQLPVLLRARSTQTLRKKPGRTEYQRGIVRAGEHGELEVSITGNQGSGVLSSMVQANGLIVLHHDQGTAAAGDWVDVLMFDGVI